MSALRGRLRLYVVAWLVFQVAMLSALVPRDCCSAHRPAAEAGDASCHETAAVADHCTVAAADAAHCPSGPGEAPQPSETGCSMRGVCNAPMAVVSSLLSNYGAVTESVTLSFPAGVARQPGSPAERPIGLRPDPDPLPPRA
jgi:hypothetical protein